MSVLGGIGAPKFLDIGAEECTNPTFDNSTTLWTGEVSATITRTADYPNFYGDYCGLCYSPNIASYVKYVNSDGNEIDFTTDRALVILHYRKLTGVVDHQFRVALYSDAPTPALLGTWILTATSEWNRVAMITNLVAGAAPYFIQVRIYPTPIAVPASVLVTKLIIRPINEVIQLTDYPTKQKESYDPEELYDIKNIIGGRKVSILGFRHLFNAHWDFFDATDEQSRRKIANADSLCIIPHDDVSYGILTALDKTVTINWAANKAVGHEGDIILKATELLERIQHTFDA